MTQASFSGTGPVREHARFDVGPLHRWMCENVEGFAGPLEVAQFKGGQSNPTYQILTKDRNYVLRRKPMGDLIKGAHAIDREARVMSALERVGFPVPHIYGECMDPSLIGSEFFLMEMVEGRIFWDASFSDVAQEQRHFYLDALNTTLAQLHGTDYRSIGLENYGRVGGYVERQIGRWSSQYLGDKEAGSHPAMDRLVEWLPANIPTLDSTSITHGDFRADNVIFHATEPRILAVLDWELSTLGDPLADFAYHAMMFRMPPDILGGLAGIDLEAAGLPTEAEYVATYCQRTGRSGIAHLDFYIAFNMFRFAAILHGIKGRVQRGTASSADAAGMGNRFARVAELAWQQAERASRLA